MSGVARDTLDLAKDMDTMMSAQKVVGAVDMMIDDEDGGEDEGEDEDEIHWDVAETGIVVRMHRYHFGTMGLGDTAAMCCGAVVVGKDVGVGVVAGRTNFHSTVGDMTPMVEWVELPAAVVPAHKD